MTTHDDAVESIESTAFNQTEKRFLWALALCVGGVLFVVFSSALGAVLVRQPFPEGNGYAWSHDDANQAAEILRWLGGMMFVAGLGERILGALARLPSAE